MKMLSLSYVTLLAVAAGGLAGCVDDRSVSSDPPAGAPSTMLEAVHGDPQLSLLGAATEFASNDGDITAKMAAPGSFTLFAPTNIAFRQLAIDITGNPNATPFDLFTPANRELVRTVLLYQVLDTKVEAADIPFGEPITPLAGGYFKIDRGTPPIITDGRNRQTRIVRTDIEVGNGVIHLTDNVLLPANKTVVATAVAAAHASSPEFTILVQALVAAHLTDTLNGPGPFTVFAPTDAAFASLLGELGVTKQQLLANIPLLTRVLTYHVVPALVLKADVPIGAPISTVETGTFTVDSTLAITDGRGRKSKIVATDILAQNGVIHVIDKVILPAP